MLRVTSIHLGGDGQPASVELEEGATIQDLASAQGLSVDGAVIRVNGHRAEVDAPLTDGDRVTVTPTGLKGAEGL